MCFGREEQCAMKPAFELRLQRANAFAIEPGVALRTTGKRREFWNVPNVRNDQRALTNSGGEPCGPPLNRLFTELCDKRIGVLPLTPRRQHSARVPRTTGGIGRLG